MSFFFLTAIQIRRGTEQAPALKRAMMWFRGIMR